MISAADILLGGILIVDDKEVNIQLLERMLRGAGYVSVTSTMNPNEVCALHRKYRYSLILLDLQMPGMDGFQVMEELKEIEQDGYLPILVISAQPGHKLRALHAGAKDFVSKPFELPEVLARVNNLLEVRLLHRETQTYSEVLQRKVEEVEASRELIRQQSDEVRSLYDKVVAEQKRSVKLSLTPGAMVGLENEERVTTHWYRSLRLRHPWLQINLLTAFAAAAVVGLFQGTIDRLLILTVFLPVLADQAGNTGSQALAITLRGMALGELKTGRDNMLLVKEALLGLLNGAIVGCIAAIAMFVVAAAQRLPNALMLSLVVFLAMIGGCVISSICGAFVPLLLKRFGADPATASSILLTTATNVASMGLLLGLAAVLVK